MSAKDLMLSRAAIRQAADRLREGGSDAEEVGHEVARDLEAVIDSLTDLIKAEQDARAARLDALEAGGSAS